MTSSSSVKSFVDTFSYANTYTIISPDNHTRTPITSSQSPGFSCFSPLPVQLRQAIFPCRNLTETMNYKNRIIGTGTADPKTLKANALNWRKHPDAQRKAMQDVLGNIGWIQDVIINKTTGNLIDGHLRVETAIKNKEAEIPVKYVELTEDEEKVALATFDPISMMAEQDDDLLKQLLAGVDTEMDLSQFHDDYDKLMRPEHTAEELDAVPSVPKEAKTKRGDVYRLGEHVLMCGDSTSEEDMHKLLSNGGGQLQVDMLFTDPPYGVSYSDKNEFLNSMDKGNCVQTPIANDAMPPEQMYGFWKKAFEIIKSYLAEYSAYYVTAPQGGDLLMMMMMMMKDAGLPLRHCLIWVKNNHVLGRSDYNYKHEPILYGWIKHHKFYAKGDFKFSTWEIPKPNKNDLHPTMKPVSLIKNAILNSTLEEQIVLDVFGGSGSTLIACEETGRKCRMMELAPEYCDVIVERWEKLTGKKAELIA